MTSFNNALQFLRYFIKKRKRVNNYYGYLSMILAEVTYYPIGDGISAAKYVKEALNTLKETGLRIYPGSMSTVIEGKTLDEIFFAIKKGEEKIISMGIKRVETIIKIDHRLDIENSVERKMKAIS
jgi:uncharacterized protein (TIGR00106 family)